MQDGAGHRTQANRRPGIAGDARTVIAQMRRDRLRRGSLLGRQHRVHNADRIAVRVGHQLVGYNSTCGSRTRTSSRPSPRPLPHPWFRSSSRLVSAGCLRPSSLKQPIPVTAARRRDHETIIPPYHDHIRHMRVGRFGCSRSRGGRRTHHRQHTYRQTAHDQQHASDRRRRHRIRPTDSNITKIIAGEENGSAENNGYASWDDVYLQYDFGEPRDTLHQPVPQWV